MPALLALLMVVPCEKRIGPVILDEKACRLYRAARISRTFRKIARKADWPDDVRSVDSRQGLHRRHSEPGLRPPT